MAAFYFRVVIVMDCYKWFGDNWLIIKAKMDVWVEFSDF
jgi:hypothetical protein